MKFNKAGTASRDDLLLVHTPEYIDFVKKRCAEGTGALDQGATFARPHMERAASHVVGAVMDATRRIIAGNASTVFVPISGFHHAFPDEARLYCLYNDPAIAIQWALTQLKGNVGYIDIDIHQGDGVYRTFADDPRVYIADLHEDPSTLFPHSPETPGTGHLGGRRDENGSGAASGTKLNIPLSPFTDDQTFLKLWEEAKLFIRKAKPEYIVFECGVDCLEGNPLSNQKISTQAIAEITRRVYSIARETAEGRLLVLGGGGYDLNNVTRDWTTIVSTLLACLENDLVTTGRR